MYVQNQVFVPYLCDLLHTHVLRILNHSPIPASLAKITNFRSKLFRSQLLGHEIRFNVYPRSMFYNILYPIPHKQGTVASLALSILFFNGQSYIYLCSYYVLSEPK